ncbi:MULTISPECIES: glycosyltransferase [unclassified Cyanobium]|uniref:glycosyltransferase family 2 protein n=1 Tax=unclassified Cyanobium TaxID=2627006 RepID=UPI0020CC9BE1|nr:MULTISPECIES: glycosyltransferase [unclassified Cyanobium]MCP9860579.1 glycosyltransferase [Cyanobium sp. Cruz-8H5]MCP9867799.1 glycosyltransferase [Cyanobium sp. Cruz-8D1]
MFSIAIPLFNKASSLELTLKSCIYNCVLSGVEHEIIVLNNASDDVSRKDLDDIIDKYPGTRCIHLHQTISAQDNWLLSLNLCQGEYLKLQLADDIMPVFNISETIQILSKGDIDYVIGRTIAVFETTSFRTSYFDIVNQFRSLIHSDLTDPAKMRLLASEGMIFDSRNPFGDANALIFRRRCLSSLNKGIGSMMPAFTLAPDLDMYLQVFTCHKGTFVDSVISYFHYYDSSPCVRMVYEPGFDHEGLRMQEKLLPLYFISSSQFYSLTKHLTDEQKAYAANQISGIVNTCLDIREGSPAAPTKSAIGVSTYIRSLKLSINKHKALFLHRLKQLVKS